MRSSVGSALIKAHWHCTVAAILEDLSFSVSKSEALCLS